jgi:type I restriction enzyme, S subunit
LAKLPALAGGRAMSFPRYPKYKASGVEWLGDVPEHWEVAPLKRNLSINNGKDHKLVEQEVGYPVYGSGGIFAWAGEYLYEGEAVLLGRKGTIDKPLYVNERFWTVDTMFYAIANKNANSKYFYYVSTQIPFDLYSTNTALPSMTQSTLGSHIVATPKIDEQTKIVAFLDNETAKIDALIAEQEKLIELLKERRSALISAAVTGKIDVRKTR